MVDQSRLGIRHVSILLRPTARNADARIVWSEGTHE